MFNNMHVNVNVLKHTHRKKTVNNEGNFTPNMVAAELSQILVETLIYVLFDCIDPDNDYNCDREKCDTG